MQIWPICIPDLPIPLSLTHFLFILVFTLSSHLPKTVPTFFWMLVPPMSRGHNISLSKSIGKCDQMFFKCKFTQAITLQIFLFLLPTKASCWRWIKQIDGSVLITWKLWSPFMFLPPVNSWGFYNVPPLVFCESPRVFLLITPCRVMYCTRWNVARSDLWVFFYPIQSINLLIMFLHRDIFFLKGISCYDLTFFCQ